MLSEKQALKFKKIYESYCGREIGLQEAKEKGLKLLRLFKLVYKPIKKEDLARFQLNSQSEKLIN